MIEQHMSLNQAAAHFMLAGSGSVARWLKVYEERGEAGLRALRLAPKETLQYQLIQKKRHQHWSCQKTDALRILKASSIS
ncbi:helix-turn-helix domain containing protein (plasmid) [Escherichia coli]|nr:helix-turn-helix domain containing protein [Escherichia coli]